MVHARQSCRAIASVVLPWCSLVLQNAPGPRRGPMEDVMTWIMDADPAIRWQAQRDLIGAPPQRVAAERARVAQIGWGRKLLDLQVEGQWADGAYFPGPNWLPTRSEEHTSELQSRGHLVCRLLLEK